MHTPWPPKLPAPQGGFQPYCKSCGKHPITCRCGTKKEAK